jgi:hypothetical protein
MNPLNDEMAMHVAFAKTLKNSKQRVETSLL